LQYFKANAEVVVHLQTLYGLLVDFMGYISMCHIKNLCVCSFFCSWFEPFIAYCLLISHNYTHVYLAVGRVISVHVCHCLRYSSARKRWNLWLRAH